MSSTWRRLGTNFIPLFLKQSFIITIFGTFTHQFIHSVTRSLNNACKLPCSAFGLSTLSLLFLFIFISLRTYLIWRQQRLVVILAISLWNILFIDRGWYSQCLSYNRTRSGRHTLRSLWSKDALGEILPRWRHWWIIRVPCSRIIRMIVFREASRILLHSIVS